MYDVVVEKFMFASSLSHLPMSSCCFHAFQSTLSYRIGSKNLSDKTVIHVDKLSTLTLAAVGGLFRTMTAELVFSALILGLVLMCA